MARHNRVVLLLLGILLVSCASQPVLRPVTDRTARFPGRGYSALSPQGDGWYIQHHSADAVSFKKFPRERTTTKDHTFIATVMVMQPPNIIAESSEEWQKKMKPLLAINFDGGNFRLVDIDVEPLGAPGSYCVQYDVVQEERNNPLAPSAILDILGKGLVCLDESEKFIVHAFYSSREPQGSISAIDDALKKEGEQFLADLTLTPRRDK